MKKHNFLHFNIDFSHLSFVLPLLPRGLVSALVGNRQTKLRRLRNRDDKPVNNNNINNGENYDEKSGTYGLKEKVDSSELEEKNEAIQDWNWLKSLVKLLTKIALASILQEIYALQGTHRNHVDQLVRPKA